MEQLPDGIFLKSGVVIFIIKVVWEMIVNKYKKNAEAMGDLSKSVSALSMTLVELKAELRWVRESMSEIPGMKDDLNKIGKKVRDMSGN